jgi:hypothetical protein
MWFLKFYEESRLNISVVENKKKYLEAIAGVTFTKRNSKISLLSFAFGRINQKLSTKIGREVRNEFSGVF